MHYYLELVKNLAKKYFIEIILVIIALLLGIGSFALFLNSPTASIEKVSLQNEDIEPTVKKMYAEISGAVNKPGVYELPAGSRLNDLLKLAHGLSDQADTDYFSRNFNLARYIQDQEKVYIPSLDERAKGLFSENLNGQTNNPNSESGKININTASIEELDLLPGIGQITAQKIIENKPYQKIDQLLDKKIVKQNIFDSIKNQITAQ